MSNLTQPKWQLELDIFSGIKTMFILEGNVYDIYPVIENEEVRFAPLDEFLYLMLKKEGYKNIIFYDPINRFHNRFEQCNIAEILSPFLCGQSINKKGSDAFKTMLSDSEIIKNAVTNNTASIAFVLAFSSRYLTTPDAMDGDERVVFLNMMYSSINSGQVFSEGKRQKNLLFMLCEKINDLPAWLYLNNPYEKTITVPLPNKATREMFVSYRADEFIGFEKALDEEKNKFKLDFTLLTEGMKTIELDGLKNLCNQRSIDIFAINDAVSLYKYGIKDSPWKNIDSYSLKNAEEIITKRVIGQETAVKRTVDIIKRAAVGMSGLQHSSSSKPRGIMFFAGPTGTGKTELAKSIAELLFGDENSYIRFDMSEFRESNSDQRLFGAPPGYVGFDVGGQLTNAVREKPFSIILFDEIEKAHPSIMDKFLQILEDGRMTDGQGETIYFSESIIVFTSNLGVYVTDDYGNKTKNTDSSMSYEEIQSKFLAAIRDYFNLQLGRPELLNRIGNNFIVFDYINEKSAFKIMEKQLKNIKNSVLKNQKINIKFSENAIGQLYEKAVQNLEHGGRGIGNVVEECLLNPLSRYIFNNGTPQNSEILIESFTSSNTVCELACKVNNYV